MTRIFVPNDSAALAVGAEAVARALRDEAARRGIAVEFIRTGSRGLYWLEPLIEIETPQGRVGYGPLSSGDAAGVLDGGAHEKCIGIVK